MHKMEIDGMPTIDYLRDRPFVEAQAPIFRKMTGIPSDSPVNPYTMHLMTRRAQFLLVVDAEARTIQQHPCVRAVYN